MSWFSRRQRGTAPKTKANPDFEVRQDGVRQLPCLERARKAKHLQNSVTKVNYGASLVETATKQLMSVMETINEQTAKQQTATSQAAAIITELSRSAKRSLLLSMR